MRYQHDKSLYINNERDFARNINAILCLLRTIVYVLAALGVASGQPEGPLSIDLSRPESDNTPVHPISKIFSDVKNLARN